MLDLDTGGLQDMNPWSRTNACAVHPAGGLEPNGVPEGAQFDFQWNDPYDVDVVHPRSPTVHCHRRADHPHVHEDLHVQRTVVVLFGKALEFPTDGVPVRNHCYLVLSVTDPDGNNSGEIDTGTSPENYVTTIKKAGAYKITVTGYGGDWPVPT